MKQFIVDASVAIKWFIPEIHADAACQLLENNYKLAAPELIFSEIGNIIWKKWCRKEITLDTAQGLIKDFQQSPFTIHDTQSLFESTWEIARQYQRSFYDSLYLALAKNQNCQMVTADLKLYNALRHLPIAKLLLWVEDVPHISSNHH